MKRHFLLLLIVIFLMSSNLKAQLNQGAIMGGASLSSSWGSLTSNPFDKGKFIFGITPSAGYFLSDNFVVGASIPIQIIRPVGLNTGVLGFSPFVRLYFGDYKSVKFFFVGKAGYNDFMKLFQGTQDPNQNATGYLGSGVSFFISKSFAVEGLLKYEGTFSNNVDPSSSAGGEIGIQYFFSTGAKKATKK